MGSVHHELVPQAIWGIGRALWNKDWFAVSDALAGALNGTHMKIMPGRLNPMFFHQLSGKVVVTGVRVDAGFRWSRCIGK